MSKVNITMPQEAVAPVETVREPVSCIGLIHVQNLIPTKLSELTNDIELSPITYTLTYVDNQLSLVGSDGSVSRVPLSGGGQGGGQITVSDDGQGNVFISSVGATE